MTQSFLSQVFTQEKWRHMTTKNLHRTVCNYLIHDSQDLETTRWINRNFKRDYLWEMKLGEGLIVREDQILFRITLLFYLSVSMWYDKINYKLVYKWHFKITEWRGMKEGNAKRGKCLFTFSQGIFWERNRGRKYKKIR